jgi:hypothetical protein
VSAPPSRDGRRHRPSYCPRDRASPPRERASIRRWPRRPHPRCSAARFPSPTPRDLPGFTVTAPPPRGSLPGRPGPRGRDLARRPRPRPEAPITRIQAAGCPQLAVRGSSHGRFLGSPRLRDPLRRASCPWSPSSRCDPRMRTLHSRAVADPPMWLPRRGGAGSVRAQQQEPPTAAQCDSPSGGGIVAHCARASLATSARDATWRRFWGAAAPSGDAAHRYSFLSALLYWLFLPSAIPNGFRPPRLADLRVQRVHRGGDGGEEWLRDCQRPAPGRAAADSGNRLSVVSSLDPCQPCRELSTIVIYMVRAALPLGVSILDMTSLHLDQ